MEKRIVNEKLFYKDFAVKDSRGFIEDTAGQFIKPYLIKVSDEDAFKLYQGNEWVGSVVNRIVSDCAKIKPRVVPKELNKKITASMQGRIDVINEFLDDPNNNKESFREIREKFIRDILIYGRGAVEKVLSPNSRKLIEVYALSTENVEIKVDEHGNLPETGTYLQKSLQSGKTVTFDKDEVIILVLYPTSKSIYGIKPVDILANSIASDILRSTYNSNFFVNGAEASGIISLDGMSKTELKKFRQYWQSAHKGAKNSHKMVVVNVPTKYDRMSMSNHDMEFSEYGKELRGKIFAVYNMQPIIMGVVDANTGKLNSQEQVQAYKDGALKPILDKEAYCYTKEIIAEGFGFTDIRISFLDVDLADAVQQSNIDRTDSSAGIITINEIRTRRGLQPVKWGDTPLIVLPGGNQVDPNTGRLVSPSSNGNSSGGSNSPQNQRKKPKKSNEYTVDEKINLIKGFCILKRENDEIIKKEDLEMFVEKMSDDYDERRYLDLFVERLIESYDKNDSVDILEIIEKVKEVTKESVFYWNCVNRDNN